MTVKREVIFDGLEDPLLLFGEQDKNIRFLEKEFSVTIFPKDNSVKIEGEDKNVLLTEKTLKFILHESQRGIPLKDEDLNVITQQIREDITFKADKLVEDEFSFPKTGKIIKAKTTNQADYLKAINNYDLVFGTGPAGTGKTYLAVAMGLMALVQKKVQRLILTRPVVEAGENLGFLPGDLQQKINPYLRPLFDAIFDMIPYEDFMRYKEREQIEIAPLAYMRGRTLNNAFTILDEAQNTTLSQIKMFLTRLGPNSKTIITGDLTQVDLPKKSQSGLIYTQRILKHIDDIKFVQFDKRDIVRHRLVKQIVKAFEIYEEDHK